MQELWREKCHSQRQHKVDLTLFNFKWNASFNSTLISVHSKAFHGSDLLVLPNINLLAVTFANKSAIVLYSQCLTCMSRPYLSCFETTVTPCVTRCVSDILSCLCSVANLLMMVAEPVPKLKLPVCLFCLFCFFGFFCIFQQFFHSISLSVCVPSHAHSSVWLAVIPCSCVQILPANTAATAVSAEILVEYMTA